MRPCRRASKRCATYSARTNQASSRYCPRKACDCGNARRAVRRKRWETRSCVADRSTFRDAVINNCGGVCALTGLAVRELLVASHILPWRSHPEHRLNVRNGLSLSRLHDAAFDRYLIAFDDAFRLLISPRLKAELSQRMVTENFGAYAGESLCFPNDAALPEGAFLATHRAAFLGTPRGQNGRHSGRRHSKQTSVCTGSAVSW